MNGDFLEQKRKQIDKIDNQVLHLIKERLSLMPEIAKFKKVRGLPILQTEREKELLETKKALAKELGLDEIFTETLFRLIVNESKRIQEENQ